MRVWNIIKFICMKIIIGVFFFNRKYSIEQTSVSALSISVCRQNRRWTSHSSWQCRGRIKVKPECLGRTVCDIWYRETERHLVGKPGQYFQYSPHDHLLQDSECAMGYVHSRFITENTKQVDIKFYMKSQLVSQISKTSSPLHWDGFMCRRENNAEKNSCQMFIRKD